MSAPYAVWIDDAGDHKQNRARRTKEGRARQRERERRYHARPQVRARLNEQARRRLLRDGGRRKAEERRRYRERHPDRVAEQNRKQNERPERQREKREYSHLYLTKYVGPGVAPTCRHCDGEVPWDGRGRPRLDCFVCRPLDSRERKSPRTRRLAARQVVRNKAMEGAA